MSRSVSSASSSSATYARIASPSSSSGTPIDRRLADARDRVERVLDLDRAHLLAACLDDVVAAADEVEEPVLVDREVVVRAEHSLAGERPLDEHLRGQLRLPPVPDHHVRAADVEDARLARRDGPALVVEHERLGAGDRLADGGRLLVEQLRLEVAHALALGQPVHAEDERVREDLAQRVVEARRQRGGGVRDALDRSGTERRPLVHRDERRVDGRHAGEDGDLLLLEPLEHLGGVDERPLEHERRAAAARSSAAGRGRSRTPAAARSRIRSLRAEPQVLGDAARREHHVPRGSSSRPSGCRCCRTCRSARRGRAGSCPGRAATGSPSASEALEREHPLDRSPPPALMTARTEGACSARPRGDAGDASPP